jgi:hypothetical protein
VWLKFGKPEEWPEARLLGSSRIWRTIKYGQSISPQHEPAENDRGDDADNDQDNEPKFHSLVGAQDFPFHRGLGFFAGLLFLRPSGLGGFTGRFLPLFGSKLFGSGFPTLATQRCQILRKFAFLGHYALDIRSRCAYCYHEKAGYASALTPARP